MKNRNAKKNILVWLEAQFERKVTAAEAQKGQITIPASSSCLFTTAFRRINQESMSKRDPRKGLHVFYRAKDREPIQLKLVFRNPPRRELRLYFNVSQGIKAAAGQIFYARFEQGKVLVGTRDSQLRKHNALLSKKNRKHIDDDGDELNQLVYTEPRYRKIRSRTVIARRIRQVEGCMRRAGYRCEAGFNSNYFVSLRTGRRYLEGHHLIPLFLQSRFRCSLDIPENIFALSPHAHRAIHHGKPDVVRSILDKLVVARPEILKKTGVSRQSLYQIYGCD